MKAAAPASTDGSMTSWNWAPEGDMCCAAGQAAVGVDDPPRGSSGALPALASRSAGMRISGTSNSAALPLTLAALAWS